MGGVMDSDFVGVKPGQIRTMGLLCVGIALVLFWPGIRFAANSPAIWLTGKVIRQSPRNFIKFALLVPMRWHLSYAGSRFHGKPVPSCFSL